MNLLKLLLIILTIIIIIIFPIWCAIQGWRKGYKSWAVITGIIAIIPLAGTISGILLFLVAKLYQPNYNFLPSPRAIIGFGTKFYCASERKSDQSFITTLWFIAFYIPIFPIQSYRIIRLDSPEKNKNNTHLTEYNFKVIDYLKYHLTQIYKMYSYIFSFLFICTIWLKLNSGVIHYAFGYFFVILIIIYSGIAYFVFRAK